MTQERLASSRPAAQPPHPNISWEKTNSTDILQAHLQHLPLINSSIVDCQGLCGPFFPHPPTTAPPEEVPSPLHRAPREGRGGERRGEGLASIELLPSPDAKGHPHQLSCLYSCCSLAPARWDGEENQKKKVKLVGWDKDSLLGQQRKRKITTRILTKEYTKRVTRNAICSPDDRTPSPSPSRCSSPDSPLYLLSMMSYGMEYSFGYLGSPVLALSHRPSFLRKLTLP